MAAAISENFTLEIIDRATPPHIKPENSFQWLNRITFYDDVSVSPSAYLKYNTKDNTVELRIFKFEIKDKPERKMPLKLHQNVVELLFSVLFNNELIKSVDDLSLPKKSLFEFGLNEIVKKLNEIEPLSSLVIIIADVANDDEFKDKYDELFLKFKTIFESLAKSTKTGIKISELGIEKRYYTITLNDLIIYIKNAYNKDFEQIINKLYGNVELTNLHQTNKKRSILNSEVTPRTTKRLSRMYGEEQAEQESPEVEWNMSHEELNTLISGSNGNVNTTSHRPQSGGKKSKSSKSSKSSKRTIKLLKYKKRT